MSGEQPPDLLHIGVVPISWPNWYDDPLFTKARYKDHMLFILGMHKSLPATIKNHFSCYPSTTMPRARTQPPPLHILHTSMMYFNPNPHVIAVHNAKNPKQPSRRFPMLRIPITRIRPMKKLSCGFQPIHRAMRGHCPLASLPEPKTL